MLRLKIILISSALILTGSILFYFTGYKDKGIQIGISCLLIFIGWIVLASVLAGQKFIDGKKISFKKDKPKWLRQKSIHILFYLTFGGLIVFNLIFVSSLTEKRVSLILQNSNTLRTSAVVTKIENRSSRGGQKQYAIIEYQTIDSKIEQAIYNYDKRYSVGQRLEIKYSVDHPDMFELIRMTEKK